jgi:predicted nucleic acid-binding protein
MILIDAGPLVALLHADDAWHSRCRRAFKAIREPVGTAWPVVTEAMHLLGFSHLAQDNLWEMIERGVVEILPLGNEDFPRMRALMHAYRDLPMDLADAALVRIAEREKLRRVFTVDRRDFSVYRPKGLGAFVVLP